MFWILRIGSGLNWVAGGTVGTNSHKEYQYNKKVRQLQKETAKQGEIKKAIEELNGAWKSKYTEKVEKISKQTKQTAEEEKKEIQKLIQELNMAWEQKYKALKNRKVLSKEVDPSDVRDAVTGLSHAWEDKYLKKVSVLQHNRYTG